VLGRSDSRLQFWINGETSHGVRSADIDCDPPDPNDTPPVCGTDLKPTDCPDRARYILEHATSLEAYVNPRLEFHTLQGGTDSSANLYVSPRIGFLSLKDAPDVDGEEQRALQHPCVQRLNICWVYNYLGESWRDGLPNEIKAWLKPSDPKNLSKPRTCSTFRTARHSARTGRM
jgi:hypothetical protein